MSNFFGRQLHLKSPLQSEYPLSLSNKSLCPKCWEEEWPKGKKCCAGCESKNKFHKLWPGQLRAIWDRDRGVCANCGLDTVALLETARVEFMKGGSNANGRRTGILFSKGYTIEDADKRMWMVVPADRDNHVSVENSITICNPCHRKHRAANGRAKNFVQKTLSLFDEPEVKDVKKLGDDENAVGYTAT